MFGLGGMEIVALLVIGLLLFGKKLPDFARTLAKSINSFKHALQGVEDEIDSAASRRSMPLPPERMPPPRFDGSSGDAPAPSA